MSLKRNLILHYLRLLRRYKIKTKITSSQRYAAKIFRGILDSNEYELILAPISGVYYLKWKEVMFVYFGYNVQIVNGKYFYEIDITQEQSEDISRICKQKLEEKSRKVEMELNSRVTRSLATILNELNK